MYSDHFGDALLLADVHHLDPATIPAVSIATASFPCTDLSLAGNAEAYRQSLFCFLGISGRARKMDRRPPFVLIENVPGFLTSRQGRDLHAA